MFFVYVTTNKVNGKKYVGFSSMTKKNWESYLGSGKILRRAVTLYGEDAFEREILETFQNRDDAISFERNYIIEHKCHLDPQWYNIATGYVTNGFKGKTHSEEHKRLKSERMKGHVRSQESRLKQSETRKSRSYIVPEKSDIQIERSRQVGLSNKGKTRTEAQRARMSEAHRARWAYIKLQRACSPDENDPQTCYLHEAPTTEPISL